MTETDFNNFYMLLKGLYESYGRTITDEIINFNFLKLRDCDYFDIEKAILSYDDPNYPPNPNKLLQIIVSGNTSNEIKEKAINAWQRVESYIHRCGYISSPDFQDDVIHQAIQNIGGWISICQSTNAEQTRNNFLREYKEVAQSGVWQHYDYVGNSNQIALKDPIDGTIKLFNSVQDKNNFLQFTKENQKLIAEKNKSYLDRLNELEEPTQKTETQETHATINNKFVCRDVNKKIITDKKGNELFDFEKYNTVYCVGGSVSRDEKGEHFEGCKFFNVNLDGRHFEVRNKYQGRYQERAEQQASMYQSTVNNMR